MALKTWDEIKNFCVVCGTAIDKSRVARGAVTCTKEHAKERRAQQKAVAAEKQCMYCRRPSTPDEREAFKRFRDMERRRPDLLYPDAWESWRTENKDDVKAFAAYIKEAHRL